MLLDPYANAFLPDGPRPSEFPGDDTAMTPGVHECKYEMDSLAYAIRLMHGVWKVEGGPGGTRWKGVAATMPVRA